VRVPSTVGHVEAGEERGASEVVAGRASGGVRPALPRGDGVGVLTATWVAIESGAGIDTDLDSSHYWGRVGACPGRRPLTRMRCCVGTVCR
jgi:hypothetical protein